MVTTLLLTSCAIETNTIELPSQIAEIDTQVSYTNVFKLDALAPKLDSHRTWKFAGGEELASLLASLKTESLDIKQADFRIRQAEALLAQSRSALLPHFSITNSTSLTRSPDLTGEPDTINRASLASTINWDADIFGAKRSRMRSSALRLDAAALTKRELERLLTSQIAFLYVSARTVKERIAITEQLAESFEATEAFTDARYRAGTAQTSALDVQIARQNAASTRANLPSLYAEYDTTLIAIDVLLGEVAGRTKLDFPEFSSPVSLERVELPSPRQLFRSRPDLAVAELNYLAALADLNAAAASRLPSLSLSSSATLQENRAEELFDLDNMVATIAASLITPLYQGGRLKAEQDRAEAVAVEVAHLYASLAIEAVAEVETALVEETAARERITLLKTTLSAAELSERLASDRYRSGQVNILTVLETRRALNSAQQDLVLAEEQMLRARIELLTALGERIEGAAHG